MNDVFKLHERRSQQIKELRLLIDNGDNGVYKIYIKWPGSPELDDYMRIIYTDYSHPDALDFDGGPMIYKGFHLDDYNVITDIYRDKNSNEFLVKVECLKNKE